MNEASKTVASAILGLDGKTIIVNDTAYAVMPPTIERIAGAAYYLADIEDCESIADVIRLMKNIDNAAKALAWFVCEEQDTKMKMVSEVAKLAPVIAKAPIEEILDGLEAAFSLIDIENFRKLSALARNVGMLTAKPIRQETPVS